MQNPIHLAKFEKELSAGAEWLLNTRDWVVLQLIDGDAYILAKDIKKYLAPRELIVCPPQVALKFLASVLGRAIFRGLAINVSSLTGFLTAAERRCLENEAAQQLSPFLSLPPGHELAERLERSFAQDSEMTLPSRLAFVQTFAELLAPQMREAVKKEKLAAQDGQDARHRLLQFINRMPESELTTLSLRQLAKQIHACERHASRLFQEVWGEGFRTFIAELRLKKACQLLIEGKLKIIDVALESGHGSLAHFNYVFKKRLRLTPTEWRARHLKKQPGARAATRLKYPRKDGGARGRAAAKASSALLGKTGPYRRVAATTGPPAPASSSAAGSILLAVLMVLLGAGRSFAYLSPPGAGEAASASAPRQSSHEAVAPGLKFTAALTFKVDRYEVEGNTLLTTNVIRRVLTPYTGGAVGFDIIKKAGGALQLAYRERGYPTVGVSVPHQTITNGIVRFEVTEGKLVAIKVAHNQYFSSNNVMRALPGLTTNGILNSKIFQAELDRANGSRDRQISPVLAPGPEPGTSEMTLDVKDRLPLHAKLEFDDYTPPQTPPDRLNFNVSYDNLWQLEQSIGFQYGFSPQRMKETLDAPEMVLAPIDWPAVTYYSAFYRAPLGSWKPIDEEVARDPLHFGYNEATHEFNLPPSGGRPEINVYANRTTTGTALDATPVTEVVESTLENIRQQSFSQQLTSQATAGMRLSMPLPNFLGISSQLSLGVDYKYYEVATLATNFFYVTTKTTNTTGKVIVSSTTEPVPGNTAPSTDYVPISVAWAGTRPDNFGTYDVSLGATAGTDGWFHRSEPYPEGIVISRRAGSDFVVLRPQVARTERLPGNFSLYANLSAQWANEPLINLEQMPLGGVSSVRGYREGERYGDAGWVLQSELRSPTIWLGKWGADKLFGAQLTGFSDYGQSHLYDPAPGQLAIEALWGAGAGLNFFFGAHVEGHILAAWALRAGDFTRGGTERILTSVSAQF